MNQKNQSARLIILVLIAVCFFAFIASALASGLNLGHECTGDDCLVCMAISLRERVSSWLVLLVSSLSILALATIKERVDHSACRFFPIPATPVCLKVKLSD